MKRSPRSLLLLAATPWGCYNVYMHRLLPFAFLLSAFSFFGLAWIIVGVDPDTAPWYIFALFVGLIFLFVFNLLGLFLYFTRTKFVKNYDKKWYVKTSFKMAFFIAIFLAILTALAILQLISLITGVATIVAVGLLAVWVYLGKK